MKLRNKFTIKNILLFIGAVMQNQHIYRGVLHNVKLSRISENLSKFNFAYRGISYLKKVIENKNKETLKMSYRGVSFKKS